MVVYIRYNTETKESMIACARNKQSIIVTESFVKTDENIIRSIHNRLCNYSKIDLYIDISVTDDSNEVVAFSSEGIFYVLHCSIINIFGVGTENKRQNWNVSMERNIFNIIRKADNVHIKCNNLCKDIQSNKFIGIERQYIVIEVKSGIVEHIELL